MVNGHGSVAMPIDGRHGLSVNVLGRILGRIFTKLDMMNGHGSVTMPIDGRHGPVITAVTVE